MKIIFIIYNARKDEKGIVDILWDFNLVNNQDLKIGRIKTRPYINGRFLNEIEIEFNFYNDYMKRILKEVKKIDDEWIKHCDELMDESRDWISRKYAIKTDNETNVISWERQLYHMECQIQYNRLLHSSEPLYLIEILDEMKRMGEFAYIEKQMKQKKLIDELLNDFE